MSPGWMYGVASKFSWDCGKFHWGPSAPISWFRRQL